MHGCLGHDFPPTIEAVTKPVAGRYVTDMVTEGTDRKTANRKISAVSAYWRWLLKRTTAEVNPWSGQSLSKAAVATGGIPKRTFTDAELTTLLNGGPDPELLDAILVAALSGMRIEEAYRLTVADTVDGWFNIRDSKTRAGIRRVPIHTSLGPLMTRRQSGKPATAYLFHEAGRLRDGYERSMPASKRFGHYRKRVGVDEREQGRRQSNIDFHSLRRWFITQARNAGIDRATVAAVVGHEAGNITDDVYSPATARQADQSAASFRSSGEASISECRSWSFFSSVSKAPSRRTPANTALIVRGFAP